LKYLKKEKYLKLLIILIALHTFAIGLVLTFLPVEYLEFFGYKKINESFFPIQAGAFHIILSAGYILALREKCKERYFLQYMIIIKFFAFVFLLLYVLLVVPVLIVIISAFVDLAMGILLLIFYINLSGEEGNGR
jgi:hypothetical protein